MAGQTTFIPIVVKLDSRQLDAFAAHVKKLQGEVNQVSSPGSEAAARARLSAAKKVEDDFLKWKAEQANKAYAEAERHLKQMTADRIAAEKKVAAESVKIKQEAAKQGGVSFGGFGIPGLK